MPRWSPAQYQVFADQRGRPFHDLVARIGADDPGTVIDLGCGPGEMTATLADRWPRARITGLDSSAEMIEAAVRYACERVRFVRGDLRDWAAAAEAASVDVIVSNATLQWVPDQLDLLGRLVTVLAPGGWLAIQIPGNHDTPLHAILRELSRTSPYAEHVAEAASRFSLPGPQDYLDHLAVLGCRVDAWETTYYHVLAGADPVFEWIRGTGARPVLQALPDVLRGRFAEEYRERLRAAYPAKPYGTVLAYRRVFAVAQMPPMGDRDGGGARRQLPGRGWASRSSE